MDKINKNYFVPGRPVRGEEFFGRKDLIERLKVTLHGGLNYLLIGERRIGKTSLLEHLGFTFSKENIDTSRKSQKKIFIHLDGGIFHSSEEISRYFILQISDFLSNWSINQNKNVRKIFSKLKNKDVDRFHLLDCMRNLREENLKVVILFDEIDCAILDGLEEISSFLRSIITQGHVVMIATSFKHPNELGIELPASGSPLFNIFQIEFIGLFKDEEAKELLLSLSEKSGRIFNESECYFLMDVFGNFPYFLQVAGNYIFSRSDFISCSSSQRTNKIKEIALYIDPVLSQLFEYKIRHLSDDYKEILNKVAYGKEIKDTEDINKMINYLIPRGFVVEIGKENKYRIFSRLFEEYFKAHVSSSNLKKGKRKKMIEIFFMAFFSSFSSRDKNLFSNSLYESSVDLETAEICPL